jgi:hypothetical protein
VYNYQINESPSKKKKTEIELVANKSNALMIV